MNKRLFVGGIPYAATEDQIKDYFAKMGTVVSCNIITDKYTGRSKGFGFVEMATEEEAKKAMEAYDGQDFEGRKITVKEARPMEDRTPKSDTESAGSAPSTATTTNAPVEPKPEVKETTTAEPTEKDTTAEEERPVEGGE